MHPAAGLDVLPSQADAHAVAQHPRLGSDDHQCHLVDLRHPVKQDQAVRQHGAKLQAALVDDDGQVVAGLHADGQRGHRHRDVVRLNRGSLPRGPEFWHPGCRPPANPGAGRCHLRRGLLDPVQAMISKLPGCLPSLFGAAEVLGIGVLMAGMTRRVVTGLLQAAGSEKLAARLGLDTAPRDRSLAGTGFAGP